MGKCRTAPAVQKSEEARMITRVDVAVVGGGPAGAVTAQVLASAGRRVVLIDRASTLSKKIGESLPGAARPLLKHLGLLSLVEQGPHLPSYGNCSSWGSESLEMTDFIRDPNGLGWQLDRVRFDQDVRQAALNAGADFLNGSVNSLRRTKDGWSIRVGEVEIEAEWMIDATGRSANIAKTIGVNRQRDNELMAVYAWFQPLEGDTDTRTLIEAASDGWWYTSRLPAGARILVYHTDANRVAALLREPGAWQQELGLTRHVQKMLNLGLPLSDLRSTEACGARLDRMAGDQWLAVGDAALSFDPLSSQGLFNALYSGMTAGRALNQSLLGDSRAVATYVERLENVRRVYLARARLYYLSEQRWSKHSFWARRSIA